jgi:hypothetical protein
MKNVNALKNSLTALGITSLLFLTGCSTNTPTPAETAAAPSATASASVEATPTGTQAAFIPAELTPEQKAGMTPEQITAYKKDVEKMSKMTPEELQAYQETMNGPFSSRLVAETVFKAGSNLRVSGGGYKPGVSVGIFIAQLMPMPSYDAANDMYHQVGEQVHLSKTVTVVTNKQGQFDIQFPVPAGIAPQQVDIISEATDGRADLIRAEIQ